MAMAVQVANGGPSHFIDGIDVNDPEYIRQLLRPPVIKEDVRLMQERARVSLILRSPFFKKELEKIVASQMKDGCLNTNLVALKHLLDYLTPHAKFGSSNFTKETTIPVLPINDLKGIRPDKYHKGERLVRCKLASVYRLVELFGWNKGINCHITARVARDVDEFLINPLGLLYHEVTASSLSKVDLQGAILDPGTVGLGIDKRGWQLHAAIHEARPDIRCIVHLNTPATVAVSCTNSGLLPISQEAMILGETAMYDPLLLANQRSHADGGDGVVQAEQDRTTERAAIAAALNERSADCMVLMIRNNGLLAMGQSIEEAWFIAFTAMVACEAQLRLASINENELIMPVKEAQQAAHRVGRTPAAVQLHPGDSAGSSGWRRGELEFEAFMRRLDAAGYRTGHVYRLGQIHSTMTRPSVDTSAGTPIPEHMTPREAAAYVRKTASLGRGLRGMKDVEIPPATSSFASSYYGDEESRALAAAEARAKTMSLSRTHWLNTPNVYSRKDIAEVGTPTPKMIAHWTEDIEDAKRHTGGVAVPIDNPNQFAPQGKDPHELKRKQRKVKEKYYKDVKNAGPTSRILEGLDADEEPISSAPGSPVASPRGTLLRLDPANPPTVEPGHVVIVGAASKGIIKPAQRHNVGVYQSVYSPNPFDHITDEELARYRENIDRKAKGLPSLEDEEAMSRVEEARKAAEVARQAMEAAAGQPHKSVKFRLRASFKADIDSPTQHLASDCCSNTLADIPSSLLCSTNTSVGLTDAPLPTQLSTCSSRFEFSQVSEAVTDPPVRTESDTTNQANSVGHYKLKPLIRRHSAFRCWYWPRTTGKSAAAASLLTDSTRVTEPMRKTKPLLKRNVTVLGVPGETGHRVSDLTPSCPWKSPSQQLKQDSSINGWRNEAVLQFRHCELSELSPCASGDASNPTGTADDGSRAGQSYTSGAEASHDDTEKETEKAGTEKKKKRRFKMLSFARKSKPKAK